MPVVTQEARVILTIEAIRTSKKLNIQKAIKIYDIPYIILTHRINRMSTQEETRVKSYKLTKSQEEIIMKYVFDLDLQEFPPQIADVKDITNLLLKEIRG